MEGILGDHPSQSNDASQILIYAIFAISGHVRESTLGLLRRWESFRSGGPGPVSLTQCPINSVSVRRLASSQVIQFLRRETRL